MTIKNRIVTLKEALMLKAQGYDAACNNWYRPLDGKLFKNCEGFSDNSNRHRLSAPRILDIADWLIENNSLPPLYLLQLNDCNRKTKSNLSRSRLHNEGLKN